MVENQTDHSLNHEGHEAHEKTYNEDFVTFVSKW
jgi:hypothetical protein